MHNHRKLLSSRKVHPLHMFLSIFLGCLGGEYLGWSGSPLVRRPKKDSEAERERDSEVGVQWNCQVRLRKLGKYAYME